MFARIAKKYKDNIPPHYVTSLDRKLHRAGHLELMVDGLFSTSEYLLDHVELRSGVSDHCAIIAELSRLA